MGIFSSIRYALEDVWNKIVEFFLAVALFLLFAVFVLVSLFPVAILIIIGYAVFAIVSSPFDPVVKVIVFAAYSAGVFLYGGVFGFKACTDVKKEIREAIDMCEKKVLSILDDVKKCRAARNAVESKVYDFMMCIDAIRKKL
jgi:hypothetical protein